MKKAKIVLMMAVMTVITFVSCNGKNNKAAPEHIIANEQTK